MAKYKVINEIKFLIINFLVAPILGILICLLEAIGRIKFVRFDRFPIWEGRLIMVSNHPSLLEPIILPLIGFPWMNFPWVFSHLWLRIKFSLSWFKELKKEFSLSKKLIPANAPDRQNFYDHPGWKLFQGVNIPVVRKGGAIARYRTVRILKEILENDGRIIIFPEGTRTFKAKKKEVVVSSNGKNLGKLQDGAAWLALNTGAKILPIWIEGTDKVLPNKESPVFKFWHLKIWHRIVIKIGDPFCIQSKTRQEATAEITRALLELADEQ